MTGEGGYRLSRNPDTVRGPDAAFLEASRIPAAGYGDEWIEGAPTLAVEVVSPGNTEAEIAEKVHDYLEAGASRVWEVRPRLRLVIVHQPDGLPRALGLDDVLTSADAGFAVDGFALPVADIFA